MSCHVMSCHVMSCHVMSCHVMSCHVMSWCCDGAVMVLRWCCVGAALVLRCVVLCCVVLCCVVPLMFLCMFRVFVSGVFRGTRVHPRAMGSRVRCELLAHANTTISEMSVVVGTVSFPRTRLASRRKANAASSRTIMKMSGTRSGGHVCWPLQSCPLQNGNAAKSSWIRGI